MSPRGLLAAGLVAVTAYAGQASAKAQADLRYTKAQTYNAALRYLRVDLEYEVTERDPEAAYLMFRYSPPGRKTTTSGAIEIVESGNVVRVYVQLAQMPEYHEQVLKNGLVKKLGVEYGDPVVPPPDAPKKDDSEKKTAGKKTDAR